MVYENGSKKYYLFQNTVSLQESWNLNMFGIETQFVKDFIGNFGIRKR